jgi:hypothetical protein
VILEEVAAMAVTFLLLLLLVQIASAMTARSAADAATAATARRVVVAEADADVEAGRLAEEISRMIPGAEKVTAEVRTTRRSVVASARFRWRPPGPVLRPLWISTSVELPRVLSP